MSVRIKILKLYKINNLTIAICLKNFKTWCVIVKSQIAKLTNADVENPVRSVMKNVDA